MRPGSRTITCESSDCVLHRCIRRCRDPFARFVRHPKETVSARRRQNGNHSSDNSATKRLRSTGYYTFDLETGTDPGLQMQRQFIDNHSKTRGPCACDYELRIEAGGTTISTRPVATLYTRPERSHAPGNAGIVRTKATSMATAARGSLTTFVLRSLSGT